ncbi:hypothetical protein PGT21_032874 [Puccinia graminis f. sp. tritici]|uniref:Uncharacterized protein n=1 Tax=Puccinia graminis f. sp. tritici TaxID=56615 RepID=A0A5B0PWD9_PUCGR|nr:hypothetical protein PGTUg99_019095 [Puccinia graminis f. sp. tritici]KAA1104849.1 hypothetical protein PGT21_032874 [Puccinia graminis f. sp. tritici]
MNEATLRDEVNLLSRLIYSNKNQHRSSIWFRRATEVKRWSIKLLPKLQQPPSGFLDQFESRLLRAYDSIVQNLARTEFMAVGMTFIASFSRIHSIIQHLQLHQRINATHS